MVVQLAQNALAQKHEQFLKKAVFIHSSPINRRHSM